MSKQYAELATNFLAARHPYCPGINLASRRKNLRAHAGPASQALAQRLGGYDLSPLGQVIGLD